MQKVLEQQREVISGHQHRQEVCAIGSLATISREDRSAPS